MSDVPKVYLKRVDLTNSTSSSMEGDTTSSLIENSTTEGNPRFFTYFIYRPWYFKKYINNFLDVTANLSRNEVLDELTEKSNQQGKVVDSLLYIKSTKIE